MTTPAPKTVRLGRDAFGLEDRALMTAVTATPPGFAAGPAAVGQPGDEAVALAPAPFQLRSAGGPRVIESVVAVRNQTAVRLSYQIQFGAGWQSVALMPGQATLHRAAGANRLAVVRYDGSAAAGYQEVRVTMPSKNFVTGGAEGWSPRYVSDGMVHDFRANGARTGWVVARQAGLDTGRYAALRSRVQGFENMGANFEVLGPGTGLSTAPGSYNCISWTLDEVNRWTFPADLRGAANDLRFWDGLYARLGYRRLPGLDLGFRPGVQKVVLYYGRNSGAPGYTHAARQETDGAWSSKLGAGLLVKHASPYQVAGEAYGQPAAVYARAA